MLTVIVARARNGAIGRDGAIPWRAPEDLAFFQRETLGGALVMGRRTWHSLPRRPLPRRMNIVVTRATAPDADSCVRSVEAALAAARDAGHARVYAIGGAAIYAALLPQADRLLMTEVALDVADADTFLPPIPPSGWQTGAVLPLRAADPVCTLHEYLRR